MRVTVVYIREYPTQVGEIIARTLKNHHYTLTGTMRPELTWELAVSNCDDKTVTLLECAVSEYIVQGSYSVELDEHSAPHTSYISRLLATSKGIDVNTH